MSKYGTWMLLGLLGLLNVACAPAATLLPFEPYETTSLPRPNTVAPSATSPAAATATEELEHVTLTILYDNNEHDQRLETAWGFSCLVQGPEKTILFDTGGDAAMLLRTMRALGIDPALVEAIVISHVHSDHVGGLAGFLEENPHVTVYLPQSFPENIKEMVREAGARLVAVSGPTEICRHVHSTGELGSAIREQSLMIETARGVVVITGCAHPGVVGIVQHARELVGKEIYLVLGGFHLSGATEANIAGIVEGF